MAPPVGGSNRRRFKKNTALITLMIRRLFDHHYDPGANCLVIRPPLFAQVRVEGSTVMKISARNVLSATVKSVTPGAVDTEVVVELSPGIEMVSIITKTSAENLCLKPGAKAYAIIKASNVMIGVD
jgi:molybdopterin-binding protein